MALERHERDCMLLTENDTACIYRNKRSINWVLSWHEIGARLFCLKMVVQ
jgi:hypothetical protein